MSRLTEPGVSKAHACAGPHEFRALGERVVACEAAGRFEILAAAEHAELLRGLPARHPLRERLARAGLLSEPYDFDAAADALRRASLLSWPGPARHVLLLCDADGGPMELSLGKLAVDFVFCAPGPALDIELVAGPIDACWPLVWALVQYAERKSEWSSRRVRLTLRCGAPPSDERREFLRGHRVELRLSARFAGKPAALPPAHRVLARVAAPARLAPEWIDRVAEAGAASILLEPDGEDAGFLEFYAAAVDRLLQLKGRFDVVEERAAGMLAARRWALPGQDLLAELCYDADGRIYSSERAAAAGPNGLLKLGDLGATRYEDFARSPAVHAVLAAALAENQPMCGQCAYHAFCSVPPSESLAEQGTLWGRQPDSGGCARRMGILDVLFARLADEATADALSGWAGAV